METLVQYLLDEGAIWLPRVIGVVVVNGGSGRWLVVVSSG